MWSREIARLMELQPIHTASTLFMFILLTAHVVFPCCSPGRRRRRPRLTEAIIYYPSPRRISRFCSLLDHWSCSSRCNPSTGARNGTSRSCYPGKAMPQYASQRAGTSKHPMSMRSLAVSLLDLAVPTHAFHCLFPLIFASLHPSSLSCAVSSSPSSLS